MSEDIELVDQRPTVVCAVALNSRARQKLADMLGEVRLVDIREPVTTADVVLAPSCSPNTLAALKDAYPTARMIVVELEDFDNKIEFGGPVTRLRKAGADAYLTADSLEDLAHQLTTREATSEPRPLLDPPSTIELNEATIDDIILGRLEEMLLRRTTTIARTETDQAT